MTRRLLPLLLAAALCGTAAPALAADAAAAPGAAASVRRDAKAHKAVIRKSPKSDCREERAAVVRPPDPKASVPGPRFATRGSTDNPPCDDGTKKKRTQGS